MLIFIRIGRGTERSRKLMNFFTIEFFVKGKKKCEKKCIFSEKIILLHTD